LLTDTAYEVNSIIEDKTGKFWFATRNNTFVYDGKTFTVVLNDEYKPFKNVREITQDTKGAIWLAGADGLSRFDGRTSTNFTKNFVSYVYEDRAGNIWTSSQRAADDRWALSRYDQKSLSGKKPAVTEIKSKYENEN
jgi:ligand-binding sensor domain-containing protein